MSLAFASCQSHCYKTHCKIVGTACIYTLHFFPLSPQMSMSALVAIMAFVIRYATTILVTTTAPVELDTHQAHFMHAQVLYLKKGNINMQSFRSSLHHCEAHLFSSTAYIITIRVLQVLATPIYKEVWFNHGRLSWNFFLCL